MLWESAIQVEPIYTRNFWQVVQVGMGLKKWKFAMFWYQTH